MRPQLLPTSLLLAALTAVALTQTGQRGPQDKSWNRRPAGAGEYQIVLEVSGRVEVSRFLEQPNPLDLRAICDAKSEAERRAFLSTEGYLKSLSEAADRRQFEIQLTRLYQELGQLYSYRGQMAQSVENFEAAYNTLVAALPRHPEFANDKVFMEELLGVAWMRRGELENCVHNHNAETCIFPLSKAAEHKLMEGSEKAAEYFKKHLAANPDNLEVRWLLNLAYMTLGKYPQGVPPAYLIPPSAFASKDKVGKFIDVASPLGVDKIDLLGLSKVTGALANPSEWPGKLSDIDTSVKFKYQWK